MTADEYSRLSELEKADIVWEFGEVISREENADYKIVLYRVEAIYVEMTFLKNNFSWPAVRAFTTDADTSMILSHPDGTGHSGI